jgi:hypothetical protein
VIRSFGRVAGLKAARSSQAPARASSTLGLYKPTAERVECPP